MLYDKRWDKTEINPDMFSLEGLIAWLEKQPAEKSYAFNNCDGQCLLGQYMASVGEPWSLSNYERLTSRVDPKSVRGTFPIGFAWPQTFGAALKRARAALRPPQESA